MSARCAGLLSVLLLSACGRLGFESHAAVDAGADFGLPPVDSGTDSGADFGMDMGPSPTLLVAPTSGLTTTEAGGAATFTVVLGAAPAANVTIMLSSSDIGEGRVSPAVLAFTPTNWNAPQTVTATGVDDALTDGPQPYTVVTAPTVSSDSRFNGINGDDVSVTNTDNESAGLTASRTSGLATTEGGGTDTFTVVLNTMPTADVTLTLTSSRTTEATVSPDTIMFTESNWASPQLVTVTGVDDALVDGDQTFTVVTSALSSPGTAYDGISVDDISGVNHDDETAAILVSPTTGLTTSEAGATALFTVVLQAEPANDVSMPVASSDTSEGTPSASVLVFTIENWNVPQAIIVTGADDAIADGNQSYTVSVGPSTSSDAAYSGLSGASAMLTNTDDETASLVVTPTSGLVTTEAGGTATFTVALSTAPAADVTLDFTSTDTTEGTVAPSSFSFTTANWSSPQTCTVSGVDDLMTDGDQSYSVSMHVRAGSDATYAALSDETVSVTNTDNESPGITVSPTTGLTTSELGTTADFTVVLNAAPTASVIINLASDLTSEGTIAVSNLTFTPANWAVPQTVTVTGEDEGIADGAHVYHVTTAAAISGDASYNGMNASDVTLTNLDNDAVGISVAPLTLSVAEGGASDTFTVRLTSQPTANVTIPLRMQAPSQGAISPASLVFSATNWASPQVVTVSAMNDSIADGSFANTAITDPATSTDLLYSGMNGADVTVTNTDNDTVGITVTPTSGLTTTESGGQASFTMRLTSQPTATVTVSIASSDATEGTVSPATVTFTTSDWLNAHTVTVTGVSDALADGNIAYSIVTGTCSSSDGGYNGLVVPDVAVTNLDNTSRAVAVSPTNIGTTEAGGSATFSVVLVSAPTADVSFSVTSNDLTEGTVSPASVTFTTGNWSVAQIVTVVGVDDPFDDGNIAFTIVTGNTVSTDPLYSNLVVNDVSVSNVDDDTAGVTTAQTGSLFTWEGGGSNTFSVRLGAQPTANVTIPVSSLDLSEGTVAPASLLFTTLNWNVPQLVTVSGVDDSSTDGDIAYQILLSTPTSTDTAYSSLGSKQFQFTNADDDGLAAGSRGIDGVMVGGWTAVHNTMSNDGQLFAFQSTGWANLIPEDTNGSADIYVIDRTTLTPRLVTYVAAGIVGNNHSYATYGGITGNGSFVMFDTSATNLGSTDTNTRVDTYVAGLDAHTLTRVSLSTAGDEPNADTQGMGVSEDGRYALFTSTATNLVVGDANARRDLFLRDTLLNTTTLVTVSSAGVQASGDTFTGAISGDGRYIAFGTNATNLVAGDTNSNYDVFVRDTMFGTTTRVSLTPAGLQSTGGSSAPDISPDGRYVAFTVTGSDMFPGDTNGANDVVLRDLMLGTNTRVTRTTTAAEPNGNSLDPTISNDGQRVAYHSAATNVVPGDTNGVADVFVYDVASDMTARVSLGNSGTQPNTASYSTSISGNGEYVGFTTSSQFIFVTGGWVWCGIGRVPF